MAPFLPLKLRFSKKYFPEDFLRFLPEALSFPSETLPMSPLAFALFKANASKHHHSVENNSLRKRMLWEILLVLE